MSDKMIITLPTGEKLTLFEEDYKKYLAWKDKRELEISPFVMLITKKE